MYVSNLMTYNKSMLNIWLKNIPRPEPEYAYERRAY